MLIITHASHAVELKDGIAQQISSAAQTHLTHDISIGKPSKRGLHLVVVCHGDAVGLSWSRFVAACSVR